MTAHENPLAEVVAKATTDDAFRAWRMAHGCSHLRARDPHTRDLMAAPAFRLPTRGRGLELSRLGTGRKAQAGSGRRETRGAQARVPHALRRRSVARAPACACRRSGSTGLPTSTTAR